MKKLFYLLLFPLSSFAQISDANLNLEADTIRTESHAGKNTAQRVGRMFKNIIANKWSSNVQPFSLTTSGTSGSASLSGTVLNIPVYSSIGSFTTTGTSGAATFSSGTLNIPQYQGQISLTTSGTSGVSTLIGNTLNIPNYTPGASTLVDNIINIGAWNMTTTATVVITHGLTQSKIRSVSVYIVDDTPTNENQLPYIVAGTAIAYLGATTATQQFITCNTASFSASYSGGGNRGYILIRTTP